MQKLNFFFEFKQKKIQIKEIENIGKSIQILGLLMNNKLD